MIVWRNGAFLEGDNAVSHSDRAFLVGEGVFETMLLEAGAPAFLEAHLQRLKRGADLFGIELAWTLDEIRHVIGRLAVRNNQLGRAVCRITLSRSGGARGLLATAEARPELSIVTHDAHAPRRENILIVTDRRRPSFASTNIAKCVGSYAENILARRDAERARASDAIMTNEHGRIACASASNLFLVTGDRICTPATGEGALPGITRAIIIESARATGIEVEERPIELKALAGAELLLTNSVSGVVRASLAGGEFAGARLADWLIAEYKAKLEAEFNRQRNVSG